MPPVPPPEATVTQQPQTQTDLSACTLSLHWFTCPVGPCDVASGWTQQKTSFLAAAILHSHTATRADHTENATSDNSSIFACIAVACWVLAWLTLQPWRCRQYVPQTLMNVYRTTQHLVSEDSSFHAHCCEGPHLECVSWICWLHQKTLTETQYMVKIAHFCSLLCRSLCRWHNGTCMR